MPVVRLIIIAFLCVLPCCAGCGDDSGLVPVEGLITLDGQPMPDVEVTFDQPELGPNKNKGYIGRTDAEGRYTLKPIMEDSTGIRPGKYRVSLTTTSVDPTKPPATPSRAAPTTVFVPAEPPPPPEKIPPAYRDGKLTFDVPPEGTEDANFDLKSK